MTSYEHPRKPFNSAGKQAQETIQMSESGLSMSYQSFVLRLWSEEQDGRSVWRFTLLEPHTGTRLGFESLAALFEHLGQVTQSGTELD